MAKKANPDQNEDLPKKEANEKSIPKSTKKKTTSSKDKKIASPKVETPEPEIGAIDKIWDEKYDIDDWAEAFPSENKIDKVIAAYKKLNEMELAAANKRIKQAKTTTETPIVETPVVETPIVETPIVETPVVETPVVETPVVETPVVETPVVETPVVETPVVETPVVETPVVETPVVETPVVETPVVETPVVETPVVETPVVETPIVETPVVETLVVETPVVETPVVETPVVETPVVMAEASDEQEQPDLPSFVKEMSPEEYSEIFVEPPIVDENTPIINIPGFESVDSSPEEVILENIDKHPVIASIEEPKFDEEVSLQSQIESLKQEKVKRTQDIKNQNIEYNDDAMKKAFEYLQQINAFIEIRIEHPLLVLKSQPDIINPAPLLDDPKQQEFVYPIYDYNDRLMTTKSLDHNNQQLGMFKIFQTIEKMIAIMHQRIAKLYSAGGHEQEEIKVYLNGNVLCKRKAFEVIINLTENWLVMDFDPGQWGSNYLDGLQKLYKKGFSYPPSAPRDGYQYKHGISSVTSKSKGPS